MIVAQITGGQIRAIHTILSRIGMGDDDYRVLLRTLWGAASCKELSRAQAGDLLARLAGPYRPPPQPQRRRRRIARPAAPAPAPAGAVVSLASPFQRRLIEALIGEVAWEYDDGYARWLQRSLGLTAVRTAGEARKAIDGLKGLKRHGHRRLG